ncbi:hypothetical protein AVEN_244509-1 [Araneus ventricosus]|uniref:Uncharacterized protein n=1 Tax=Araneus ventricosus TaxID=182803 RepID=A0A4Y2F266_ARAVE|nr:hypothetical protein AVEN_244509-1 [Araneus ventricosus]
MDKWLKTGTLKRSASRTEIRTRDLGAMEITVDHQEDNHEVPRPTDWPVQPLFYQQAITELICHNEQFYTSLESNSSLRRMSRHESINKVSALEGN